MSMRIDKYYTKPIVWDKTFADSTSEQFEVMSYEAMRAVNLYLYLYSFSPTIRIIRMFLKYFNNLV